MAGESKQRVPVWPSIRRLLQLSGRNQIWLYLAMVIAVLGVVVTIAWNFTLGRLIDAVSTGQSASYLTYLGLTALLVTVYIPLSFLSTRSVGIFSERTLAGLARERSPCRPPGCPCATSRSATPATCSRWSTPTWPS